jgi:hypothetical protein
MDKKLRQRDIAARTEVLATLGHDSDPQLDGAVTGVQPGDRVQVAPAFGGSYFGAATGTVDPRESYVHGCVMVVFDTPVRLRRYERLHIPFRPQELVAAGTASASSTAAPEPASGAGLVPYRVAAVRPQATRDPFTVDPETVDRGNRAHADLQDALAEAAKRAGCNPWSAPGDPDFDIAWTNADGHLTLAEVKSLTSENEARQVRLGLGQLLDYAHTLRSSGTAVAKLVLAVESEPTRTRFSALCRDIGVLLIWPDTLDLAFAEDEGPPPPGGLESPLRDPQPG